MDEIVRKILEFSDPYLVLKEKVKIEGNKLTYGNFSVTFERPLLISVGKASYKMAKFFLERVKPVRSVVVTPKGSNVVLDAEVIESTHPNVSELSVRSAREVKEALAKENYDLVLFLLSGGASALMEDPLIPLEEFYELNRALVSSGLSINEINVVRKHLSTVKGGNLALLSKAPVVTFIVSDVPGNDLSSIGSGPTAPDPSTVEDAREILSRIGLEKYSPFLRETPKNLENVRNFVILDNMQVLKRLSQILPNPFILTSEIRGEASSFGENLASIYNSSMEYSIPFSGRFSLIVGGEPEVTIRKGERVGKGGRNGEVALSFLKWVRKRGRFKLYAIATDGIDGNSEYAGCVIDEGLDLGYREINEALANHSSYELLEKYGVTVKTGLTYTNVNNVYLLIS
ncbi:MAG: DUF4147 domain-containing protein [Candidatus Aramenus sp.]|nr:DUF4147 domain-containing protein [Candidatus Aramenus sp.]